MSAAPVLISWVAINNDPYERERESGEPRVVNGERIPGPTLTLLCDEASPYARRVRDVVLLYRASSSIGNDREQRAVHELREALCERSFRVHLEPWNGDDPTDHREVFEFLRHKIPQLRQRFHGQELLLHISPGTPSMHTVWVLMAETGFVELPFTVVKSYRRDERQGRQAVVPVELGIETFYKAYKAARPRQVESEDQAVIWDPSRFQSKAMKRVYVEARRFAQLNVPVLIQGERGTGKTTLASWIRANSPFKREEQNARWPSIACGQYNTETMRAELFGYKRGAFTGATSDREGLLAAAHHDTLFLDEVGDVNRDLQRLLIRTIEEKQYFALGDDKPRTSDFRLITATNIDEGELRRRLDPDFFDRISPLSLVIPPLREVPEELSWLWEAVYSNASRRAGVPERRAAIGTVYHQRVVAHLQRHPLPGNLRDLFRVAYRVLAARSELEQPEAPADAIAYGLDTLSRKMENASEPDTEAGSVAAAFARRTTIDALIEDGASLDTVAILTEFKAYIASEVRRIARKRRVKASELCGVSERTLRNWTQTNQEKWKNPADKKKKSTAL